jgi:D-3-phosphoglycerate dehydrogenase / 2-oxoglutarate reductase
VGGYSECVSDHTVLVTTRSFGSGDVDVVRLLESTGLRVFGGSLVHDPDELAAVLALTDAWITGHAPITARHLDLAPRLRVITRFGVDLEPIDVAAAHRRGIVVTHTPGFDADAVADHTLGLLLAALRGIVDGDRRVRSGRWTTTRGRQLRDMVVGVVGYGATGRAVARRLESFGARVLVHESFAPASVAAERALTGHAALVAEAEAVVLLSAGGLRILDGEWLDACPDGQLVVNAGPAGLVDEDAVAAALRSGRLSAFAADSLRADPAGPVGSAGRAGSAGPAGATGPAGSAGSSPLLASDLVPSVVVTPHLGAETLEAIDRMGLGAANDVLAVLAGRAPQHQVEPPEPAADRLARYAR